jgi:hypothetical protein
MSLYGSFKNVKFTRYKTMTYLQFCQCENQSLTFKEEYRRRVSEKMVLRIFSYKEEDEEAEEDVAGG